MSPAPALDLTGPLPQGRLAVQASAGTGKTYSLAALTTRYVAEDGVAAADLLVVTFTRAATAELRSRIRDRMREAVEHLDAEPSPPTDDPLLAHLAAADRKVRLGNLRRAVTEFDAATVTTIHGFATQVLGSLGATAGTDLDAALTEEDPDLVVDVCADVLAAASTEHASTDVPTLHELVVATHHARSTPDLRIEPAAGREGATAAQLLLAELAGRSVAALRQRRRAAGTMSFDDVLVDLRDALRGRGSDAVVEALRRRYRVALIDEFQDTDPVQWDIFRTLFGERRPAGPLVLVGDPKQAIYAFRGANVHTYLDAVGEAGGTETASLPTSWRSDGALLSALETTFAGATFGHDDIAFTAVDAAPDHRDRRLLDDAGRPLVPLRVRAAVGEDLPRTKGGSVLATPATEAVLADMADQLAWLFDHGRLPADGERRAVRPSDVAVLVKSNVDAERAQEALLANGIPAVLSRSGSVLDAPAADHWRWLLHAMARPSDPRRARTFALSWFGGWTPAQVADADDDDLIDLQERLHGWHELLQRHGVAALVRTVWSESGVAARALARPDGDRSITDLEHVAELLQAAAAGDDDERLSPTGLLTALDRPPTRERDPDADKDGDVAARRVESEAEAVQVMTVWVAKGLEFPVVCCPTLWRGAAPNQAYRYQDETGQRALDVAKGEGWPDPDVAAARKEAALREERGEQLRLLYVALTRARHQTLVWWAPVQGAAGSALARLLFARADDGSIDRDAWQADKVDAPKADRTLDRLQPLAAASGGTISVEAHGRPAPGGRWAGPAPDPDATSLTLARLGRHLDRSHHRWSFSAVTARGETTHFDPFDEALAERGGADEAPIGEHEAEDGVADEVGSDATGGGAAGGVARSGVARSEVARSGVATSPVAAGAAAEGAGAAPEGAGAARAGATGEAVASSDRFAALPAGAAFGTLVHTLLEHVDLTADDLDAALAHELGRALSWQRIDLTPRGLEDATAADGRRLLVEAVRAAVETPLGPLFDGRRLRDLAPADRLDELGFELLLGEEGPAASDRDVGALLLQHLPEPGPLQRWAAGLRAGGFEVELAGHLTGAIDAVVRVPGTDGGPDRFVVVDYKTNRLSARGEVATPAHYGPHALAEAMAAHHYPLQALLYAVALHRYLRWRVPGYDPATHLGGVAYLFLRGMTGADVTTTAGAPHGVFAWRPPAALITDLSDLLAGRSPGATA